MAIEVIHHFNASPEALWAIVGTPNRVDWVPGLESCEWDGEVRTMNMPGAGQISERVYRVDDDAMVIEYGVIKSAAPLDSHRASIEVEADGDGARMTWKTAVEPVAVEPFIRDSMTGCIERIEAMLAG